MLSITDLMSISSILSPGMREQNPRTRDFHANLYAVDSNSKPTEKKNVI